MILRLGDAGIHCYVVLCSVMLSSPYLSSVLWFTVSLEYRCMTFTLKALGKIMDTLRTTQLLHTITRTTALSTSISQTSVRDTSNLVLQQFTAKKPIFLLEFQGRLFYLQNFWRSCMHAGVHPEKSDC